MIKILYPSGSVLNGIILSEDGNSLWNIVSATWDALDSLSDIWTNYTVTGVDSSVGSYLFTEPTNLPANNIGNKYTLLVSKQLSDSPAKTDQELGGGDFYWNGEENDSDITITISSFSTVENADSFFSQLLYKDEWTDATSDQRQQALNQATQSIRRLPFIRTIDLDNPPTDLVIAQYYEAFELLSGSDLNKELRSLRATSRGLSSVRSTYDSTLIPEHLRAGLVSPVAWSYLSPYVDRTTAQGIKLRRVS